MNHKVIATITATVGLFALTGCNLAQPARVVIDRIEAVDIGTPPVPAAVNDPTPSNSIPSTDPPASTTCPAGSTPVQVGTAGESGCLPDTPAPCPTGTHPVQVGTQTACQSDTLPVVTTEPSVCGTGSHPMQVGTSGVICEQD